LQKEHGSPGAQIVSPPELKGQAAEGAVVLNSTWNWAPHTRDPGRRSRTMVAEEQVEVGGAAVGGAMGEVAGPAHVNSLAVEMAPTRGPRA
jgi:hypothetical protein